MITKITPLNKLKQEFLEILINNTTNVSKVVPGGVLNGIAFGNAKLGQKILKDVAVLESHIFPDSAVGTFLDDIAERNGVAARFGALASTTFLRIVATAGTFYDKNVVSFSGSTGFIFKLENDVTIGAIGYTYTKEVFQTTA